MPAPRRKRPGTIALDAARLLTMLSFQLDQEEARIFSRIINRWLDNGHNLDTADVEWCAGEARLAVAGMRAAGVPVR